MYNRMMSTPVIYAIRHIATNRLYIGSSVNHAKRWRQHKYYLREGTHHSLYLQRAWDKHGEEDFEFMVVHTITDGGDTVEWEQFWLDRLQPAFNMEKKAFSYSRARKPRASRKRPPVSPETREKLRLACRRYRTEEWRARVSKQVRARGAQSSDHIEKRIAPRRKTFSFVSPAGDIVTITGLAAFCRANGLTLSAMSNVASGKRPSHHGWTRAS